MFDKEAVLELYRSNIGYVKDKLSPHVHLSSEYDARTHGAAMTERIIAYDVDSVLDLGCGTGSPLIYIDPIILMDITYHGVDLYNPFIRICRERWKAFHYFTFAEYDISSMVLSRHYDAIFCNETFSYFSAKEICAMIDFYAAHADRVFSATLLTNPRQYPHYLLIQQPDPETVLKHIRTHYPAVQQSTDAKNKFIRFDIIKEVK